MSYGVSESLFQRIDGNRCVTCNQVIVSAWVCVDCAHDFADHYGDMQAATATQLGRGLQRRVDFAAAHEQLIQCQTVMDHGVTPAERGGRQSPTHTGRRTSNHPADPADPEPRDRSAIDEPILSEYNRSMRIRKMMHAANSVGGFAELRAIQLPSDETAWWRGH